MSEQYNIDDRVRVTYRVTVPYVRGDKQPGDIITGRIYRIYDDGLLIEIDDGSEWKYEVDFSDVEIERL